MADAIVKGDDFYRAAKAMKDAGRKDLRKELNRRMRVAAKPLIPKTRAAAKEKLPTEGGLAARIAKDPQRVAVRTGKKTAGVQLVVGKRGSGARQADEGRVRHPVFGRKVWVGQDVEPGWFSGTLQDEADSVLPAIAEALDDVSKGIIRAVK